MLKWIKDLVDGNRAAAERPSTVASKSAPAAPFTQSNAPSQGPVTVAGDKDNGAPAPIVRQIVLNREARVLGYEFLLRGQSSSLSTVDVRTQRVNDQLLIRTINSLGAERIGQFREIWLTINEASLDSLLLEGLPAKATVVTLCTLPHRAPSTEIKTRLDAMKAKGFRFGLLGFTDNAAQREWINAVDYCVLDAPTFAPDELGAIVKALHALKDGLKVYARRIESYEGFEFCLSQGFDGFGGKFLSHRESWPPQPPLTPDRVRLCDVLNRLRAGTELPEIAEELRLAPEISYRFLRYINSAGMGLTTHIASIEQGALFLGREKLYRWLTLLLFNAPGGHVTDRALLEQALTRGRMMELLSGDKFSHQQRDEMFVVGVFSMFDILLGLPLPMALRPLQLPKTVAGALLEDTGVYAPYLRLTISCEQPEGAVGLDALGAELGLSTEQINDLHMQAAGWAQQLDHGAA